MPGFGRFVSQGFRPNVCHAHSYTERSRDLPRPSQQGTRQPGACGAMSWYIHGLTSFSVSGRHSLQLRRPSTASLLVIYLHPVIAWTIALEHSSWTTPSCVSVCNYSHVTMCVVVVVVVVAVVVVVVAPR